MEHTCNVAWEEELARALMLKFPRTPYTKIVSKHMVGILLTVFIRQELLPYLTDVQIDTVGVGVMDVGGNKGGVGARFQICDSSFAVVCCHLAAHQHDVKGRNADQHTIAHKLFQDGAGHIMEHDVVFWFGDLNYRIEIPLEQCYERIAYQDWIGLQVHDQLLQERTAGHAFQLFHEGAVLFPPTYKYQPGTLVYERRSDQKKRCSRCCHFSDSYILSVMVSVSKDKMSPIVLQTARDMNIFSSLGPCTRATHSVDSRAFTPWSVP